jgi:DNA polymerase elongation subunit (family B)
MSLFKKIYKTELKYSLDYIAQKYLKTSANKKVDFKQITPEIKEKNILDVRKLADLENKLHIIDFYDEIRRLTCCLWEDVLLNSRSLDMMILKEAKKMGLVLPSKHYDDNEELEIEKFEGAYRRCDSGLFNHIWKLDLSSAYPQSIINFCLDIQNLTTNPNELKVNITDRETNEVKYSINVKQNPNALLPTIAKKLIAQKDTLKQQLKSLNPETQEAKELQIRYDCQKSIVNSLFGVCALKIFRLYDIRIASAITSIIRDLLHYVEDKLKEKGMNIIYVDTDSLMLTAKEDPKDLCNQLIKQWAREKYNKDDIDISFDCEGKFQSLFVLALCHYKGRLNTKSGLKIEEKGIESKRKDASKYIQEFQTKIVDKILDGEKEETITTLIKKEIEEFKTKSLIDIAFPFKINNEKDYKSIPIGMRAIEYTKELNPELEFNSGDSYYYIYVKSFGESDRTSSRMLKNKETGKRELKTSTTQIKKNVLAFDSNNFSYIKDVDYDEMLRRNIYDKVEKIYSAMSWDFTAIKPKKEKKPRKKKEQTITEFAKEEVSNNTQEKAMRILDDK